MESASTNISVADAVPGPTKLQVITFRQNHIALINQSVKLADLQQGQGVLGLRPEKLKPAVSRGFGGVPQDIKVPHRGTRGGNNKNINEILRSLRSLKDDIG